MTRLTSCRHSQRLRCQCVSVVNDYADTFFANIFAKTENFTKPFLSVYMGAQVEYFDKKKSRKSRDIVPLSQARIQFEEGRRNPYCNKHFGLGCVLCNVQLCMDDSLDLECLRSFFCALKMITILHILAISILPWPPHPTVTILP